MLFKQRIRRFLRWSEKYLKTDMTYVARGSFWIMAGKAGTFSISLLLLAAFSNFVSKEVYGTYQYITSLAALFTVFSLPGINTALVRSVAGKKEGTLRLAVKAKLKFSLLGSLILFGISLWYLGKGNTELGVPMLIGATFFPFHRTFNVFGSFWQGKQKFNLRSKYSVLSAFLSAMMLVPVIYLTESPLLIISAFFLSHSLFDGLFLKITLNSVSNADIDGSAVLYGKHLSAMGALGSIVQHLDRIILWHFLGPVEVAVYSFGYLPVSKIKQLCPVSALSLPKLSGKSMKNIKPGIILKFIKLFIIMIPAVAAIVFAAPHIYSLIFPGYEDSIPYFRVLSLLLLLTPFQLLHSALTAGKKQKELYIINLTVPAIKIILFIIFVPMFQIWGLVYSLLITSTISGIMTLYFFLKI